MNFLVIFLPFCDFVHVQSVTDLFAKQLNNVLNVHKKRGKITKKGALGGQFSTKAHSRRASWVHWYISKLYFSKCTLLAHLLNWEKVVRLTACPAPPPPSPPKRSGNVKINKVVPKWSQKSPNFAFRSQTSDSTFRCC